MKVQQRPTTKNPSSSSCVVRLRRIPQNATCSLFDLPSTPHPPSHQSKSTEPPSTPNQHEDIQRSAPFITAVMVQQRFSIPSCHLRPPYSTIIHNSGVPPPGQTSLTNILVLAANGVAALPRKNNSQRRRGGGDSFEIGSVCRRESSR